ncbi:MAG TPA: nitroreductase family deazaflavin-dependent oxidoreductase [Dehalococcoidia bacterium]|nr:nitroreductase family deazaflavin-dependent oxidoreductase [Dehalococcoidia bacterium]
MEASLAAGPFCYITTTGRVTGRPHEIEIWFGAKGATIYMLSGGGDRSDWVRNIVASPAVRVRIGEREFEGRGRVVTDASEDAQARRLLLEKYAPTYSGDLDEWGRTALPVAIDFQVTR